jgi:hypothetical protein
MRSKSLLGQRVLRTWGHTIFVRVGIAPAAVELGKEALPAFSR